MKIHDNGRTNPLIEIEPDDVAAWLRTKADEAGYGDRCLTVIQTTLEGVRHGHYYAPPTLVVMVSNIKGSRAATTSPQEN